MPDAWVVTADHPHPRNKLYYYIIYNALILKYNVLLHYNKI